MRKHCISLRQGFTLVELLLVVGMVGIIMGIVISSIAPRRNFISARDTERKHASKQLQQAIYSQIVDEWVMSSSIEDGEENAKPVCREEVNDNECISNGGAPLSSLPPSYIVAIPVDIAMPANSRCTGYMVYQEAGRPYVYSANMGKLEGDTPEGGCGEVGSSAYGKVYWYDDVANDIKRSDLDGSNTESIVSLPLGNASLTFDTTNDKLYWTDGDRMLKRADYDGGSEETVADLSSAIAINIIVVDPTAEKIYYSEASGGSAAVKRINYDGSDNEIIVASYANDSYVDITNGKVYWESNGAPFAPSRIYRANLDGSDETQIFTGGFSEYIKDLYCDSSTQKVYVSYELGATRKIIRMDSDGSNQEDVVVSLGGNTLGINIASEITKLYWSEGWATAEINRSDPSGDNEESVISSTSNPNFIKFDTVNDKVFWRTLSGSDEDLYSADYDGSNSSLFVNNAKRYDILID